MLPCKFLMHRMTNWVSINLIPRLLWYLAKLQHACVILQYRRSVSSIINKRTAHFASNHYLSSSSMWLPVVVCVTTQVGGILTFLTPVLVLPWHDGTLCHLCEGNSNAVGRRALQRVRRSSNVRRTCRMRGKCLRGSSRARSADTSQRHYKPTQHMLWLNFQEANEWSRPQQLGSGSEMSQWCKASEGVGKATAIQTIIRAHMNRSFPG